MITPDLQNRLWLYIGGVARENHIKALSIGGMQDHVHVLLSLPATLPVAKAVQLIKDGLVKSHIPYVVHASTSPCFDKPMLRQAHASTSSCFDKLMLRQAQQNGISIGYPALRGIHPEP